jgi:hypothetical protein
MRYCNTLRYSEMHFTLQARPGALLARVENDASNQEDLEPFH